MTTLALASPSAHLSYILRLADDQLILGHRLSEWTGRAPMLEEDIALANIALDHIGAARSLYDGASIRRADDTAGKGTAELLTEDDFAYRRDARGFLNCLLVERPNGDFAHTIARQFFFSAFALPMWQALTASKDATLAAVAAKSEKEARYHVRHAGDWFVRLGDGTEESHRRMAAAVTALWPYTGELFEVDAVTESMLEAGVAADPLKLRPAWDEAVDRGFALAGLEKPDLPHMQTGGRSGRHTEHLAPLLAELQSVSRAYPGAKW